MTVDQQPLILATPNREQVSWLEILIITIYLLFCMLLAIDLVSAYNLIVFFLPAGLTIPPTFKSRFPLFTTIRQTIEEFTPSSAFLGALLLSLLIFLLQVAIIGVIAYLF